MNKYNDIINKVFGRLMVLEYVGYFVKEGTKSKRHYYKCRCTCEKNTILMVDRYKLLSGHTTSCGCKAIESIKVRNKIDNPSKYIIRQFNEYYVDEFGIGHIKMSNTEREMLCDVECMDELLKYYWNEKSGYARSSDGKEKVYAHRLVMNAGIYDINKQVDHINGNTLDNRKENLRIVTSRQNGLNSSIRSDNTSGVTGICWDKNRNKWLVRVYENDTAIYLGYFDKFEDAIIARRKGEEKYYGEYSYINSRGKVESCKNISNWKEQNNGE